MRGSNLCHLGVVADRRAGRAIIIAALDNLAKGSSGQAIQNANLMLGLKGRRRGLNWPRYIHEITQENAAAFRSFLRPLSALGLSTAAIGFALRDGINFYRSPTEVLAEPPAQTELFRIGGLVEVGSIVRGEGTEVRFVVTDNNMSVPVVFRGHPAGPVSARVRA